MEWKLLISHAIPFGYKEMGLNIASTIKPLAKLLVKPIDDQIPYLAGINFMWYNLTKGG